MNYIFARPQESKNFSEELGKCLSDMALCLDNAAKGNWNFEGSRIFIRSLIDGQDDKGFWGLIPSPKVDGDIRVLYWYMPTYIATAYMMLFYHQYKNESHSISGFEESLRMGLEASTGRGLKGHGHDDIPGRLAALEVFSKGNVVEFIKIYPEFCMEFTRMIEAITEWLEKAVEKGLTKGDWNEDYKDEMEKVLNLLTNNKEIKVFVYGSLLKGQYNHSRYLSEAELIGSAVAEGFNLYNLGSFPGVIPCKSGKVKGELYRISPDILKNLDVLEGEGSLYKRTLTNVIVDDKRIDDVNIYIYNHSVITNQKIDFEDQPWNTDRKKEYVWYASYGSNLLYERILAYIQGGNCRFNSTHYDGCTDKTPPKNSKPVLIPYKMYFGNTSKSWDLGGVSFLNLDEPGKTLGRMYMITVDQFKDIHGQEGPGENWYNRVLELGEHEGFKILTITNEVKRPICVPSVKYIEVVIEGLKETYPEMSIFDILKYLVGCGEAS